MEFVDIQPERCVFENLHEGTFLEVQNETSTGVVKYDVDVDILLMESMCVTKY